MLEMRPARASAGSASASDYRVDSARPHSTPSCDALLGTGAQVA